MSSANLLKWKRHRFSRSLKRLKWQGRSSSSGSIYDDWDVTELIPDSFDSIGIEEEDYPEEPSNTSPDGHHMAAAGFSNISFKHEVARKSRMYLIGEKEAEVEVMIDRIIKQQGSKDRALLFVIIQLYTEAKVQKFVTMLLHRGARPIAADAGHQTALHHSVQRNYVGVCQRLLEYNASPTARDSRGVTPYHIAVDNMNDDIASLLLVYTPNHLARQLYCHNGDRPAEFSVQSLLQRPTMQKTMLSLLDCMLEQCGPNNNNHKVYYQALEADSQGRPPNHPLFDRRSVSALHLVAQTDNKDVVYHDVMRLLIRRKWKEYAKIRFQLNAGIYILTVFSLTYAAIVACMADDPINYKGSLHISRALFESIGFGFAVLTFFLELNQIRKNKANYFRDVFNVIDMVSSCLLITVIPLRFVHQGKAQWFVFSFAYITWILRIFKYAAVFRQTGAYAQILWQIVTRDFLQFAAVFAIILLAFSGSYILALKGEGSLATDRDTSSFWWILFSGTRILIEAQPVTDYMENGYGFVCTLLMVLYLLCCIVILLNILIAQLSDTYQNVQGDAQRCLELNRAWIVTRVEMNSINLVGQGYRISKYIECEELTDAHGTLEKWDNMPLYDNNRHQREVRDRLDIQELNMRTVKTRLARQEHALATIREQLQSITHLLTNKQPGAEQTKKEGFRSRRRSSV